MSQTGTTDWDPGLYHEFRGLRLRPATDLLRSVGVLPEGDIIDLGCGSGAAGPALQRLKRRLVGVDLSPSMLAKARATGCYAELSEGDLTTWQPQTPPALIFTNAALQWAPDHETLLPRLAGMLAPGGTLAVQVPNQNNAPSHRFWLTLAEEMFPGRVDRDSIPSVLLGAEYHRLLRPFGHVTLWETEYYQELTPETSGHPVRRFTESSFARPVLSVLDEDERKRLVAAYDRVIGSAYPIQPNGNVLFPFRRMFLTLTT
ncbi:trans-aconitate 2-methyltransferase [Salipiger pallidus]|uniref:Trans-aconitate 2-methyltransferase n=1 Tax=Salipiger pallidus TaxID=1775170 RepID=A0A8J2ZIE1_9RHOB|nr:methyltransferase domain-containing protein [Salipiger pallidus]GGG68013.1 trans-aconitate 2-methyltransferase [Salipiger pallidus]